jgi:hypothetical protein
MSLLIRAFKHSDALERQAAKLSHVLIIVRHIGSDVCCGGHDRSFPGLGQYVDLIEFSFQVSCDIVRVAPRWEMRSRSLRDAR